MIREKHWTCWGRTVSTDYTDQQGNAASETQNGLREELAAYGYDPVNQQAKHLYSGGQMEELNQNVRKVKEYEEILMTFDKNKTYLMKKVFSSRWRIKQRKNWHTMMTNADAYNALKQLSKVR